MTVQEILAALYPIRARIDAAFDENADKWQADKHLALEEIEEHLDELIDRLEKEQ